MNDPYKVLGVKKGASDDDIKAQYRALSRKHHPDMPDGSAELFIEVATAYAILMDPVKRQYFDQCGFVFDERGNKSVETLAKERLRELVMEIMNDPKFLNSFGKIDLIKSMEQTIAQNMESVRTVLKGLKIQRKALEGVLDRLEIQDEGFMGDLLREWTEAVLRDVRKKTEDFKIEKQVVELALKIVDNYTYRTDIVMDTMTTYATANDATTTTSFWG